MGCNNTKADVVDPVQYSPEERTALIRELLPAHCRNEPVVMFSKSYCPYCRTVLRIFKKYKVKPALIELDRMANGAEVQEKLSALTGQATVPNTFIGDVHVGGCDETKKLDHSGKLAELLRPHGKRT
ncbi:Glutaredoxin-C6 [Diplonema papillatum]|nr:Glutaredoxin-C6 [Diplonema papillatum]